jgi:protocatechuate 3,4-dioxygenase beta subunit
MSENQDGVPLYLDIDILDTNTCEPLESVLVDLWHCNATGSYSSFEPLSPNTPFEELLAQLNITNPQGVDLHSGNTTFLRGMWPTDSNGMMERKTIFQGFYVERTIHAHAQVHTNLFIRTNGTVVSDHTLSTGQIFFAEDLSEQIMNLWRWSRMRVIRGSIGLLMLLASIDFHFCLEKDEEGRS